MKRMGKSDLRFYQPLSWKISAESVTRLLNANDNELGTTGEGPGGVPQARASVQHMQTSRRPYNPNYLKYSRKGTLAESTGPTRSTWVPSNLKPTTSLSPKRNFLMSNNEKGHYQSKPAVSASSALYTHRNSLTNFEQDEILRFPAIYFMGLEAKKHEKDFTTFKGKYAVVVHDHIAYRYEVLGLLGKGAFGEVLKCYDHKCESLVAIKILKNQKRNAKVGHQEVAVLLEIKQTDPENAKCLVEMKESFEFRGHFCIVFELLAVNLYEHNRMNMFQPMNSSLLRRIAIQVLIGLKHLHSLRIIHCDLKPENIMLKSENKTSIKIIDFGAATVTPRPNDYVQSRFYRAPEIILESPYTDKIDMWSFGCILYEFIAGTPLFPGENEKKQINLIVALIGLPPQVVLNKSKRKAHYFKASGEAVSSELGSPRSRRLVELDGTDPELVELMMMCLEWDPQRRISAEEGLHHKWVRGTIRATR